MELRRFSNQPRVDSLLHVYARVPNNTFSAPIQHPHRFFSYRHAMLVSERVKLPATLCESTTRCKTTSAQCKPAKVRGLEKIRMNSTVEDVSYISLPATQLLLSEGVPNPRDGITLVKRTPKVFITGDLHIRATESDCARGSARGSYSIDTEELQEPLQVIWSTEGQVLNCEARFTEIEFGMGGARAGQIWTYVVAVQVPEREGWGCIVSGVFVQILVT